MGHDRRVFVGRVGWLVASFVGGPIRQFVDLRGEVRRRLGETACAAAKSKISVK
jgi:hypothetical protein